VVAFVDIPYQKTPAEASDIQQIIETLSARRNTPIAITVSDSLAYALTLKNTDAAGRGIVLYAPDGTTVLFSADSTGVKVSRSGGAAVSPIVSVGSGASPEAAAGDHVHGAGGYSALPGVTLESVYAASWTTQSTNYAVAAGIMFVFCSAGITVTLPAAASTNRPITVAAITGSTTVAAAGGSVIGGSVNVSTGAVMNGVVSPGDAFGYKSDGTNWRAVV
jgi:hypothetical protein